MASSLETLALPAALFGAALHLGYFIHGEHHANNLQFFLVSVFGPPTLCLYFSIVKGLPFYESVKASSILLGSFLASLTASILVYRNFFHRLRHFPGPFGAKQSKLWQVKKTVKEYNTFQLLDKLHKTYGDFVRSGPNELSIIDPAVIEAVYGTQSKCPKSQWYDMSLPITSLQQLRDRELHDKRRRGGWHKAFSVKSLRAYDNRVISFADLLVEKLDGFSGRAVNVSQWFNYYSYDVMGSLGFGRSFDTLQTAGKHQFVQMLKESMLVLEAVGAAVYFCNLATKVPGDINPITKMNEYSDKCVQDRKRNEFAEPDILGHLIETEEFFGDPKRDREILLGDSRLVIVAGSDTTSAALVYTFYYIANDPSIAAKIRDELQEFGVRNDDSFSLQILQNMPYLNAVMYEGLRLHPPVPGGVFRMTPPEGLQVGEHYLPGGINLLVPIYSLQRSSKTFVKPNEFIPERWTTQPELVINKDAFMPFSAGPYGCIGKQLAMGELRTVISKLLLEFDIRLAPNETGKTLFARQRDRFTLDPGKLELCFIRRGELN